MISKMNKLTVLVYHKEYEEFLVGLRNAGVVHVAEKNSGSAVTPELQAMLAEYARCETLVKRLLVRTTLFIQADARMLKL